MNAIEQPYITKIWHCVSTGSTTTNEANFAMKNLDEPETRTAEWTTNFAGYTDVSERSICGTWKYAYEDSTQFAPQLRTSERPTLSTEKHTPRTLRGGRVIQKHSRNTRFMEKNNLDFDWLHNPISREDSNVDIVFVRLTVSVSRKWEGWESASKRKKLKARKRLVKRAESHLSAARIVSPNLRD